MPDPLVITSPANPRVKALAGLRRRRTRDAERRTLVEGYEELDLALSAGVVPEALYVCPELMGDRARASDVLERAGRLGTELVELSRAAFEKAAYREGPDGFLAVVPTVDRRCADLDLPADPLVLVCQSVEKPGNLGAMLRTADAAGVDAVVAADPVTDWGNPNTVRASKGTVFAVPVASDNTATTLAWLRAHGIPLVAATPDTETEHTAVDWTGAVAVAVGTEKEGLTREVLDAADHRVRIPMVGRADSLNVSTSAAILLYEAVRQRRDRGGS
ncbi:TrmH family RNA methyltransferase [Ornithinimicrobium sp. W1665]|uniref:TrmH family RNA methyltransferase n=1 Tax=Ornithinimicrobium sp. W1665 TaxID=3416666 RepID=UPI003CF2621D